MSLPPQNVPNPDPSTLTTAQLQRELEGLRQLIETRLDGMDRAGVILDANVNRVPTLLDRSINQITDLFEVKFAGIQKQFDERDVRTEQAAIATKIAVDAALQAQKEAANAQNVSNAAAIAKSETATAKQIDSILALMQSSAGAMGDKIDDLKGRIDRGEGAFRGGAAAWVAVGAIVTVLIAAVTLIVLLTRHA